MIAANSYFSVGATNKNSSRRCVVLLNDFHSRHESRNLNIVMRVSRQQKLTRKINFGCLLTEV